MIPKSLQYKKFIPAFSLGIPFNYVKYSSSALSYPDEVIQNRAQLNRLTKKEADFPRILDDLSGG